MSRHRFVKNLTEDDYYDDYDYDEDDYEEEFYNDQASEGKVPLKKKRKFENEMNRMILEKKLKLKGLFAFKTHTPPALIGKLKAKDKAMVNQGVVPPHSLASKNEVNGESQHIKYIALKKEVDGSDKTTISEGISLSSLVSLSISSNLNALKAQPGKLSLSSIGITSTAKKTLKLSDLMSNIQSSPFEKSSNLSSLSKLLNGSSSLPLSSLEKANRNKISLSDLTPSPSPTFKPNTSSDLPNESISMQKSNSSIVSISEASKFASFISNSTTSLPQSLPSCSAMHLTPFLEASHSKQVAYNFKDPSPDDLVAQARQMKPGNSLHSKPSSKSVSKKNISSKEVPKSSNESLTMNFKKNMNISLESAVNKSTKSSKKKINIDAEYKKRSEEQESLNLVVVGHVDAGKSTMMGHLLVQLGEVNPRTITKFKKEADELKKGSFMYAWVLDATEDERTRGVTIDCAVSHFTTLGKSRRYTLLDAPGHQDFVEKMVAGTSQADVAILVVDAGAGGFESGFENGGQTKEHALLLKALGVSQVIVAVNKMDIAIWSEERFNEIKSKILNFLLNIAGFDSSDIQFIPLSGFTGENLCQLGKVASWYKGLTLVQALDIFYVPKRPIDASFVLSVQDYFKGGIGPGGGGSVTISGRIDAGSVQVGDAVLVMPINESGSVKAIQMGDETTSQWAVAGDRVSITLSDIDPIKIHLGSVLCSPTNPVPTSSRFRASINTFDLDIPLTLGVPIVFHHLGAVEAGTIIAMEHSIEAGGREKKRPRVISSRSKATVVIQLERPISCQIFSISLELGRFLLRKGKISVGAGLIEELLQFQS